MASCVVVLARECACGASRRRPGVVSASLRLCIESTNSSRLQSHRRVPMATVPLIRYEDAPRAVKEIFDDIKRTRGVEDVNNFWKAVANQPETLKRTWELVRTVMTPGALDELTKEMIYAAVSITNNCE